MRRRQLRAAWLGLLGLSALAGCTNFDDANGQPPAEVTITTVASLVVVSALEPGAECAEGGQRIQSGVDANDDGRLTAFEVVDEGVVCNGTGGAVGATLASLGCLSGEVATYDGTAWVCSTPAPDTDTDTLAELSCVDGQVAKLQGGAWTCAVDVTADPGTDTLDGLTCGSGQIARFNGSLWTCSEDVDTVDPNSDTLAALGCMDGEIPKRVGGAWMCAIDLDTTIANTDTDTVGELNCAADQVARFNGTAWVCAADDDTLAGLPCANGQVAAFNGTAWVCSAAGAADTLASLSCAENEIAKQIGGAWLCAVDIDTTIPDTLAGLTCVDGEIPKLQGGLWDCALDEDEDTLAALVGCVDGQTAKINGGTWACADDLDTTIPDTDTLASLTCVDGDIPKLIGGAWDCALDEDEDTLAALVGCVDGQVAKINGGTWACADDDDLDTTLDAATLWSLSGNAATVAGTDYLGTSDDVAFELRANALRGLLIAPDATSPNLIGGHEDNSAGSLAYGAAIGGGGESGDGNAVHDPYGVIGGGSGNTAGNDNALATEDYATVGGGSGNTASGAYATVPGGVSNSATGAGSFAAGTQAQAVHDGAMVLADSTSADFSSSAADEFAVRANGGIRFVVGDCSVSLDATGVWGAPVGACTSDRNQKHDFGEVDAEQVLERLAGLDITRWTYNGREEQHLGPMAQDFHDAFGLGIDDKHIHPLDASGVSLKAIQALETRTEVLLEQNRMLAEQNAALASSLARVEARLSALGSVQVEPLEAGEHAGHLVGHAR